MRNFKKTIFVICALLSFGIKAAEEKTKSQASVSVEEVVAQLELCKSYPEDEAICIQAVDFFTRFIDPSAPLSVPVHVGVLLAVENLKEHLLGMKEQWEEKKRREARKDRLRNHHVRFLDEEFKTAEALPVPEGASTPRQQLRKAQESSENRE